MSAKKLYIHDMTTTRNCIHPLERSLLIISSKPDKIKSDNTRNADSDKPPFGFD